MATGAVNEAGIETPDKNITDPPRDLKEKATRGRGKVIVDVTAAVISHHSHILGESECSPARVWFG